MDRLQLITALVALFFLVGCAPETTPGIVVAPTPPTPSSAPTIVVAVTPTPTATPTPTSSPTLVPTFTPTATFTPSPTFTPAVDIVVEAPKAAQRVASPVKVSGSARVFEGTVVIQVKDAQGNVLGKRSTLASEGAPGWGQFAAEVPFTTKTEQPGTIEAYCPSPKDGSPMHLVIVPVTLVVGP